MLCGLIWATKSTLHAGQDSQTDARFIVYHMHSHTSAETALVRVLVCSTPVALCTRIWHGDITAKPRVRGHVGAPA
jgi:hypothetical protein